MSFSVNRITVLGNIGKDAETKTTKNGKEIVKFSVATTHGIKEGESWENITTWHNVIAFSLSDYIKGQLKVGVKVYVSGRLDKSSYKNKEGKTIYTADIIANEIIPLGTDRPAKADNNNDLPF